MDLDPAHWTPATFREHGHAVVDWVADYLERLPDLPVTPAVKPGDVAAQLPAGPPTHPEALSDLLADLDRVVVPGLTHWQHPGFMAYFPANASPPAILAELVSAGLGVQGMLWSTSPAATEVETVVLDWLVEACGLPDAFRSDGAGGGVIQDSASSATLCALLAARERATQGAGNADGVPGGTLTVYGSPHSHSSLDKAVRIAGIGDRQLRRVAVDERLAMRPDELDRMLTDDRAAGRVPVMVMATAGTTSTTAIDPLADLAEVCRRHGVWLHVDGAYAGSAAVCPELRWILEGLEHADSYVFNPHKWLLTNFDCTAFYVRDAAALTGALSILPEYLRNEATESGAVIDYRDWQIPLGRRFRALKLWWVLRSYGVEGLRAHVRRHVAWAAELADRVVAHPRLELAAPAPLGLVCVRHVDGDAATQALLDRANATGRLYVTHTVIDDRLVARIALGGTWTRAEDVEAVWEAFRAAADDPA